MSMGEFVRAEIDTSTEAYKRCTEAGWRFHKVEVERYDSIEMCIQFDFSCVCGKHEYVRLKQNEDTEMVFGKWIKNGKVDCAKIIEDIGSNGISHLIQDGYTDEDIVKLRKAYGTTLEDVQYRRNPKEFLEQKAQQVCQMKI